MVEGMGGVGGVDFPSSSWSLIGRAGAANPEESRRALADLCSGYWYPVYAFIRRQVRSDHDADDLTQGFFAHVLDGDFFAAAEPTRGRFRNYLLACCRNYLINVRKADRALRRGGGAVVRGLDFDLAAARYAREPTDPADPEALYLRRWAFALLDETFSALDREYRAAGQGELFALLRQSLTGDSGKVPHADIARVVGMSEPAVRKSAQRLRQRFGAELRSRVAQTVADPADVPGEISDLFAAVR